VGDGQALQRLRGAAGVAQSDGCHGDPDGRAPSGDAVRISQLSQEISSFSINFRFEPPQMQLICARFAGSAILT
jgi:hypothetical protein